jgi:nucleoporin POM152
MKGLGPWNIKYQISHTSKTSQFSKQIIGDSFDIDFEDFEDGGLYTIDLLEIQDVNGCSRKLDSNPYVVEVLVNRPTISFQSLKPIYILEGGKTLLPISLSGR